jgi:diguanylate cyclase (GGDEF)-like protein/PAS domain S-box-containing protein
VADSDISVSRAVDCRRGGRLAGGLTVETNDDESRSAARTLAEVERELSESQVQCREVEAIAGVGSWAWHIAHDEVEWSEQLYRIFGLKPDQFEATYQGYLSRVHPEDRDLARANVDRCLAQHEPFEDDLRIVQPDGTVRWVHTRGRVTLDNRGQPVRMMGTCQDINEQRETFSRLSEQALLDPLTGLPNRSLVLDRLDHAIQRSGRHQVVTAVAFVDVDDFKRVNDDLGHAVGDHVLRAMAVQLSSNVRAADTVGRFGGDEFVVVLEDVHTTSDAIRVATRLVSPIDVATPSGPSLTVTATAGVAIASSTDAPETVIRNADTAMYRAKRQGRGLVELFRA